MCVCLCGSVQCDQNADEQTVWLGMVLSVDAEPEEEEQDAMRRWLV